MSFRIIQKLLSPTFGKKLFQKNFEYLHRTALAGMNVGGGADPEISGEKFALEYVCTHLKHLSRPILFDVGANVGNYSILMRKIFKNNAEIHSFEPSNKTFKKLKARLTNKANFYLHNSALGSENKQALLFNSAGRSGLSSIYKRRLDHLDIYMDQQEKIEMATLDSFCKNSRIKHINFLKLDVEGNEKQVLDGATRLLKSKAIDFIQFEFGGCNIDSRTYFQDFYYLLKDNYMIYRILKNGLHQIEGYNETHEIFLTTNYLAERKNLSNGGDGGN